MNPEKLCKYSRVGIVDSIASAEELELAFYCFKIPMKYVETEDGNYGIDVVERYSELATEIVREKNAGRFDFDPLLMNEQKHSYYEKERKDCCPDVKRVMQRNNKKSFSMIILFIMLLAVLMLFTIGLKAFGIVI